MPDVSFDVDGLDELTAGLKSAQQSLGKEQRRAYKEVADKVAAWSQSAARSGTRQQARFAPAIKGSATQRGARIAVASRGRNAGAAVAFFGQRPRTRTGWNASTYNKAGQRIGGRRYLGGRPQSRMRWVGNTWTAGRAGQGPQPMNDVIARHRPEIESDLLDAPARAVARAFPEGGNP